MKLIILLICIAGTFSKFSIYQPQSLVNAFTLQNNSIPFGVANFGHIPWGHQLTGFIELSEPFDGCSAFNKTQRVDESPFFYIIQRGGCDFTVKVINAQNAGAKLVIIVDFIDQIPEGIVMSDDGLGYLVHIPSILIGQKNGEIIVDHLLTQQSLKKDLSQDPIAVIKFATTIKKNPTVDFALSLTNRDSFRLIRNFKKYFDILSKSGVAFNIYYDIYTCHPCSKKNFTSPMDDCLGGGRYCDLETDDVSTGRDLVNEILRQKCIFSIDQESFFHYMKSFDTQCVHPQAYNQCGKTIIQEQNIDQQKLQVCVDSSFVKTKTDNRLLQQNFILDHLNTFRKVSGMNFFPGVLINNQTYLGELEAVDIFEDVCNSMVNPPIECRDYVQYWNEQPQEINNSQNQYSFLLELLLSILLILAFFGIVYFFYRRSLKKEELVVNSSQVGQMVSQYIQFYESKDKKKEQPEQL